MFGNPLQLGNLVGDSQRLTLSPSARARHMWICGGTGAGKSKLLEHCVRQDILNWSDSKCGMLLLDPHGLVYENTMRWLAKHDLQRPIIPIDLGRDDWIVSYNLLRKRSTDPSVLVTNFVNALAYVWGENGTGKTPLFARLAGAVLQTLYENGCTIAEMMPLLSRPDVRRAMSARVIDPVARHVWSLAERHPSNFEEQISSTLNRMNRLISSQVMKATLGQPDVSLDLSAALEEGHIILVNLSTKGGEIHEENTSTFATLLLADLWAAAGRRGKGEEDEIKPFYVYLDECQKFITPTIADNLDQARGFGLHLTLAQQFPRKLINAGPQGQAMYDSILANAGNKMVFRLEHPEDAKILAQWLFMLTFNPDEVKDEIHSTKVMGHREEIRESYTSGSSSSHSTSKGRGGGKFAGVSAGEGEGGTQSFDPDDIVHQEPLTDAENWNRSVTENSGDSGSWSENESESESQSESVTRSSVFIPILGKELSSRQYRSIEEQTFRAMQKLFHQEDRHFVTRFHGGPKAPLVVKTPTVANPGGQSSWVEEYRQRVLSKLGFAMPMVEARRRMDSRKQRLVADLVNTPFNEPTKSGRRVQ